MDRQERLCCAVLPSACASWQPSVATRTVRQVRGSFSKRDAKAKACLVGTSFLSASDSQNDPRSRDCNGRHAAAPGATPTKNVYLRTAHAGDNVDGGDQHFCIVAETGLVAALPLWLSARPTRKP